MEIIDTKPGNRNKKENPDNAISARNLFLGALLIAIGIIWLLNNYGYIADHAFRMIFSWRTLLIAIGLLLITERKNTAGVIVASVGMLALVAELVNFYAPEFMVGKVIFPLMFIIVGVMLLFSNAFRKIE